MKPSLSRRHLLGLVPTAFLLPSAALSERAQESAVHSLYPSHNPEVVKVIIGASHGDIAKVKELLAQAPALAKSSWDWGFGDWETPLGAAAHTGNVEIARLLMQNGAHADIFAFAMLGELEAVKAIVKTQPGVQRTLGPHGITLLAHARTGGEPAKAVVSYLTELGDADTRAENRPLSKAEKELYVGKYVFGAGPDDHFLVMLSKSDALQIRTPKGAVRMLNCVEEHGFAPTGAPQARIRFAVEGGKVVSLRVHDIAPILVAKR